MSDLTENLRNRIEATKKHADYSKRQFVDVPVQDLELLLSMVETQPVTKKPINAGVTIHPVVGIGWVK
jgi:hypothetical protein